MKQTLVNCAILLFSLFICLLAGEAVLRYQSRHGTNYDFEMWRYAAELKEPLPSTVLPFHHKPNSAGNYYGTEIRTNSLGFRDGEYSRQKTPGRKRILFLGDSFTLGWGIPVADTYAKRLESMLAQKGQGIEVINMGVGNYNSSMEVELFKLKGLELNPDMVVLMYYINDTEPTPVIDNSTYPLLKHFYLPAYISTKVKQLKLMNAQQDWLAAHYRSIYNPDSRGFMVNRRALAELVTLCAERNIRLLMVNIPDLRRLKGYPFTFATDYIRGVADEHRLPFLDLQPVLEPYDEKSLWVSMDDPHMNVLANKLAAESIYRIMTKEPLPAGR